MRVTSGFKSKITSKSVLITRQKLQVRPGSTKKSTIPEPQTVREVRFKFGSGSEEVLNLTAATLLLESEYLRKVVPQHALRTNSSHSRLPHAVPYVLSKTE
jgi:hypothetical protein